MLFDNLYEQPLVVVGHVVHPGREGRLPGCHRQGVQSEVFHE